MTILDTEFLPLTHLWASGRPYGGVACLWKRAIDEYVTIIDCDYDWLCCIKVSNRSKDCYLLNVYMPYECEDNRDVYNDYMSKMFAFCNGIISTCIFIVGDFNADISKNICIWEHFTLLLQ